MNFFNFFKKKDKIQNLSKKEPFVNCIKKISKEAEEKKTNKNKEIANEIIKHLPDNLIEKAEKGEREMDVVVKNKDIYRYVLKWVKENGFQSDEAFRNGGVTITIRW